MSASTDAMDDFDELVRRTSWLPIDGAPKDRFILLYCAEDNSRWLASWQGDRWYGVDELGLTRSSIPGAIDWQITAWMELPEPPYIDRDQSEDVADGWLPDGSWKP